VELLTRLLISRNASAATEFVTEIAPAGGGAGKLGVEYAPAGDENPWIAYSAAFLAEEVRAAATMK
jgi:hypothetical protein